MSCGLDSERSADEPCVRSCLMVHFCLKVLALAENAENGSSRGGDGGSGSGTSTNEGKGSDKGSNNNNNTTSGSEDDGNAHDRGVAGLAQEGKGRCFFWIHFACLRAKANFV